MKSFKKYLIPSLIASVLMSMYVIVDGIFVGQRIGDVGLAAINISWPITAFLQAIGMAIGLSGGIYISTLVGKNQIEESKKIKLTTVLLIVLLGVVLGLVLYFCAEPLLRALGASNESLSYALEYTKIILIGSVFQMLGVGLLPLLKNSGKVKVAMAASLCSVGVNLLLDYIFIYLCNMTLDGAALGSVLAQVASCLICLFAYFKELNGVSFRKSTFKELFSGAVAPFILNYSYSIIIIITNVVCMHYGQDEAVAAYTLLSYISYIVIAIACAIGDAIQPLFSYNEASKDYQSNHKMLQQCLIISFCFCAGIAVLTILGKKQLGDLYNLSEQAYQYYEAGLVFYSLGFLFVAIIKIACSYLYAVNDKKLANALIILEPFVLTPIFLLIGTSMLQLVGVWSSYLMVQVLLCGISIMFLYLKLHKDKFQNTSS